MSTWAKIKFFYKKSVELLTATSTEAGYDVDNLLDDLEGTLWKPTDNTDQYLSQKGVLNSVTLPTATYKGLCIIHDETFWAVDATNDKIIHVNSSGAELSSFLTTSIDAGATNPSGVTYDHYTETLWFCDRDSDKFYNVSTAGAFIGSFSKTAFDPTAGSPQGISFDTSTRTLWIIDDSSDKIYNVELNGSLISSFNVSVFDPLVFPCSGISYDMNTDTLWVSGDVNESIYNIEKDGDLIDTIDLDFYSEIGSPKDVSYSHVDGSLWITDGTATIYQILSTFAARTADYLAIAGHNLGTINATVSLQSSDNGFNETGSDLVTNGTFTTDTTGWTAAAATLASVAGGQSLNCLEVTNSGAAAGSAYQDIAVVVGKHYRLTGYFKKGTSATGSISIGTDIAPQKYEILSGLADAGWVQYEVDFRAVSTTCRITLANESIVATETSLFDTIKLFLLDITEELYFQPENDNPIIEEFTSSSKKERRVKLTDMLAIPQIGLCYWGEAVELDYASTEFDPHGQEDKSNVNVSHTGYVTGIHDRFIERNMSLTFQDADSDLYDKVKAWIDDHGRRNFFIAWESSSHADDVFLMRSKSNANNPLVRGGLYRNINVNLIGRKA